MASNHVISYCFPHQARLIDGAEWMLFICFILIIQCNGPTSYLLLTIQNLFQR